MLKQVNDKSIDEQGERMVPAFHKGRLVYGEHISRYESIRELIKGKNVLDIASGSGYGTYLLADSAKKVIGVEIDKDAIEYAARNYNKSNIEYRQGDAHNIPLKDSEVDVVVTFETIEHIKDYKYFLKEVKRVLKPGGLAIVSTPNDPEFPEGNHFHLHEFKERELANLLRKYFDNQKMFYQYTWISAGILADKHAWNDSTFMANVQNVAPVKSSKALYFIMICSDSDIDQLNIDMGITLSEHYSARSMQEDNLARENYKNYLESEVRKLSRTNEKYMNELSEIKNSKAWKYVEKARQIKNKVKS